MKALREKGLVEAYSGRGTFVTDGTSQAIKQSLEMMVKIGQPEGSVHLAEVRAILEPEIAALAAVRCEEQYLVSMREAVAVMDQAKRDPTPTSKRISISILHWPRLLSNPLIFSLLDSIVGFAARTASANFQRGGRTGTRAIPPQADTGSCARARSGEGARRRCAHTRTGA